MSYTITLDEFYEGFVATAIWADLLDEDGDHDVGEYFEADLTDESRKACWKSCENFLTDNLADLTLYANSGVYVNDGDSPFTISWNIGADFWLTSRRHGTGFWDKGAISPEVDDAVSRLTEASHPYAFGIVQVTSDDKVVIE